MKGFCGITKGVKSGKLLFSIKRLNARNQLSITVEFQSNEREMFARMRSTKKIHKMKCD
jgi:hypothetical protein